MGIRNVYEAGRHGVAVTFDGFKRVTESLEGLVKLAGVLEPTFALISLQFGDSAPTKMMSSISSDLKVVKTLKNALGWVGSGNEMVSKGLAAKDFLTLPAFLNTVKRAFFIAVNVIFAREYYDRIFQITKEVSGVPLKLYLLWGGTFFSALENACKLHQLSGKKQRLAIRKASIETQSKTLDASLGNKIAARIALLPGSNMKDRIGRMVVNDYLSQKKQAQMLKLLLAGGNKREVKAIEKLNDAGFARLKLDQYAVRQENHATLTTKAGLGLAADVLKVATFSIAIWKAPLLSLVPSEYEMKFKKGCEVVALAAGSLGLTKFLFDSYHKDLAREPRAAAAA